jgi:hypothetical protein
MFHHVVFFKVKQGSRANAELVRDALESMRGKIEALKHLEIGVDLLRTDRSWDVCLITRFDSRADMEAYLVHPAHKAAVAMLNEARESTCAVDWET